MSNALYRNDRPGAFPKSWYAATADIPAERPALKGQHTADVCIVGAGFTGLMAALDLAEAGMKVIVLDAHRAGWGASGRNGGQVGSGFNKDQRWLSARLGKGPAKALWDMTEEAKDLLKAKVEKHAPEARFRSGVAHGAYDAVEARELRDEAEFLRRTYNYDDIEGLTRDPFQAIVKSPHYQGGLIDRGAGHIHPLRYALGLAKAAEHAGAEIYERSEVHHIDDGATVTVATGQGRVQAPFVILAGNGYLPNLKRKVAARTMPINSFIAATEPLGDRAKDVLTQDIAVADSKFVVNYFRLSEDNRLLFGGRENYGVGFPQNIEPALRKRMEHMFPQLEGIGIDYTWGGTLGITPSRLPLVTRVAPNIVSAGGFSGHGVAHSGFAGRLMAEAVRGQAERFDVFASLPTPAFPGGTMLRAPLLAAAMSWYSLRDRLGF
ncbi:FAD-binding oxidoreductase [Octadecabacter sp. 1_MG-2023]|uniref:NAD(P)/FAD-dependent oxidoreductase n=1 Tax=unclassified Octadecabacter TaxID=196158 RepID=UPI001C083FF0|nr:MULTISPECIES: FAD-binding oxidoreductase [unclassified Octadecabacter]MBU2992837.1 FAD-binding oxidoreductase [Octadecabacter sp. B2R22]MDO6733712.1 FAD-binding oxidoreductase [Octadecabacter sp. 1_MG-2023]